MSHWSFQAGPNGPATLTALADLQALRSHRTVWRDVMELGGPLLRSRMELLESELDHSLSSLPLSLVRRVDARKGGDPKAKRECGKKVVVDVARPFPGRIRILRPIPDKEGKTRVVAIGDYWSNAATLGIQKTLMRVLRSIPQDMTYRQGAFIDRVLRVDHGVAFHSVDLSNATDRWPLAYTSEVMRYVLGRDRCELWERVLADPSFEVDPRPGSSGERVRYGVGVGMGLPTWAAFALTHHAVIRWLGARVLPRTRAGKLPYCILGDDVLIWDDALAEAYKEQLTLMGVE